MFYQRLTLCFLLIAVTSQSYAGDVTEDVVYLRDGSIVRGQIIEQVPGKLVRIETMGGSVFVFDVSEIAVIKKEPKTPIAKKKNPILAAAMSVLIPGLGQIYNGDAEKGIEYFAIFVVGAFLWPDGDKHYSSGVSHGLEGAKWWNGCTASCLSGAALAQSASDAYTSAKKINRLNQQRARLRFISTIASHERISAKLSFTF